MTVAASIVSLKIFERDHCSSMWCGACHSRHTSPCVDVRRVDDNTHFVLLKEEIICRRCAFLPGRYFASFFAPIWLLL